MSDTKTTLVEYEVTHARDILGLHRKVGEKIEMHPTQAKYYLAPLGFGLKEPDARQEKVGGLDDPNVKNPGQHASGKPGKPKT